jgi:hypothetical protein
MQCRSGFDLRPLIIIDKGQYKSVRKKELTGQFS